MNVISYEIILPPEGLLLRDFAINALTHIVYYSDGAMRLEIEPERVEISFPSENISIILDTFTKLFEESIYRVETQRGSRPSLFGNDWRHTIPKWIISISKMTNIVIPPEARGWDLLLEGLKAYTNWLKSKHNNLEKIMKSFSTYSSGGPTLITWGKGTIEAPTLFKANYYAGRRGLASKWRGGIRGIEAKIRLDEHTLALSLVGAIMAKQGTFKPREQNLAVYLSVLDPGAIGVKEPLSRLLVSVRCRLSPDAVFRLVMAIEAHGGGVTFGRQPLRLITISEGGNRANICSSWELVLEEPLFKFLDILYETASYDRLRRLMEFTLQRWETTRREERMITEMGYMLAHGILLSCSGSLRPEETLYQIARSSYASTSREFIEALQMTGEGTGLRRVEDFMWLIHHVYRALRKATKL